jgi:2-oxopent-4-enoate/cis-2-oxohex-4-enoate hydratase
MEQSAIEREGDALYEAMRHRRTLAPLTDRFPGIEIDDAYAISRHFLAQRIRDGERVIGKKIGVTSRVVQERLGVSQPDFGFLTNAMLRADGDVEISRTLIQPQAEGEIAFVLERDLHGPGLSTGDVLSSTRSVHACFEIVDSRIDDWRIKIQDTIADNASCGVFVMSEKGVDPRDLDLGTCAIEVRKNGASLSRGVGAATMGSPLNAVAWLANTLGSYGVSLQAGDIILSGSLVPLEPIRAGDEMEATIAGIGSLSLRFV